MTHPLPGATVTYRGRPVIMGGADASLIAWMRDSNRAATAPFINAAEMFDDELDASSGFEEDMEICRRMFTFFSTPDANKWLRGETATVFRDMIWDQLDRIREYMTDVGVEVEEWSQLLTLRRSPRLRGGEAMAYSEKSARHMETMDPAAFKETYGGWLVSEKMDGWQVRWDAARQRLLTKGGVEMNPPPWFLEGLPGTTFVGELMLRTEDGSGWMDATAVAALRRQDSPLWSRATIFAFDLPVVRDKFDFEARLKTMRSLFPGRGVLGAWFSWLWGSGGPRPDVRVIPQVAVTSHRDFVKRLRAVLRRGGEGVVMTDPTSLYNATKTRSQQRVKVKGRRTTEGWVVGYRQSTTGTNWSLVVSQWRDGAPWFTLSSGLTQTQRGTRRALENAFPLGTPVEFRFTSLGVSGKPKEAVVVAKRALETMEA